MPGGAQGCEAMYDIGIDVGGTKPTVSGAIPRLVGLHSVCVCVFCDLTLSWM